MRSPRDNRTRSERRWLSNGRFIDSKTSACGPRARSIRNCTPRLISADDSRWNSDRGVTLPERRQSSCAFKMPARRVVYEISSEKVKDCAERRTQNETFAPLPSFLQGHTSIDRASEVFL